LASSKFYSALKSAEARKIQEAAYIWPNDAYRMGHVAISLANNNLLKEALSVIEDGTKKFPDEYSMWRLLSEIPIATTEQVSLARLQMKKLDPHNPNLK
jgi:hypothetical protein